MSKFSTIAAIVAGIALAAAPALAAGTAGSRVSDRIGATTEDSSEFAGVPVPVLLIGAAVLIGVLTVATDDDSESD